MHAVGIIPARGGSKRLPGKNIMPFAGQPLIVWTILAALDSEYIDEVYVSTDHVETALIALEHGAKVIPRPYHLALDDTTSEEVMTDILMKLDGDVFVLLQPTSPLRTAKHIDEACEMLQYSDCVISTDQQGARNGAIYAVKREHFERHHFESNWQTMNLRDKVAPYRMPNALSVDIDTVEDFEKAEASWLEARQARQESHPSSSPTYSYTARGTHGAPLLP